ncbi:MAG: nickel pincer cofactor biosynthesis protein LarB [Candidatus Aminicenantes bacterium]|nr:nickel pincer cofactor biosynthesis protein LarB [Candidatus Aminicenantes bacterium]
MRSHLKKILEKVQSGNLTPEQAMEKLTHYPYQDLDFAKLDHHREMRKGIPEVVLGLGKSDQQIKEISEQIIKKGSNLLVTKIDRKRFQNIKKDMPELNHNSSANLVYLKLEDSPPGKGKVAIITAGTSDIPVAEEAAVTSELLGNEIFKIYDVGVAGIHRLFGEYHKIKEAQVIIVVAGMEGALPSVIAGLTNRPIIAVPTSIGYGANLKGMAALLAMLNSCPGGVAVVNIDNGFGAAYMASLINHLP